MAGIKVAKTGNEAMAEAMRQINPDVVAAYPITPATEIAQICCGGIRTQCDERHNGCFCCRSAGNDSNLLTGACSNE